MVEGKIYHGRGLSAGIGFGPASVLPDFIYEMDEVEIHPDAVEKELERFDQALERTKNSTRELIEHVNNTLFEDLGELFVVQESLLGDPSFTNRVVTHIRENYLCAESAVMRAMKTLEEQFLEKTDGSSLSARAVDFLDAGMRVLGHLEAPVSRPRLPHGGVLVARRIAPSIAVFLEDYEIEGLVVENTSRSSHIAVIAQSLEIPTVGIGKSEFYKDVSVGDMTIVSANQNRVWLNPDEKVLESHKEAQQRFTQFTANIRERTRDISSDSLPLVLRGNIGLMEEIPLLKKYGGEGAGLVRTEFLFLGKSSEMPEETVQAELYHQMGEFLAPHPVNLRTFDFGGDKQTFREPESVGGRGIYRELYNKEVLETQLRAMCRAYQKHDNISVLLPLVGSVAEVKQVLAVMKSFSRRKGWKRPPLGIMFEIPSLFFSLEEILPLVDFISFGTNDLLNYLLGADRFGTPGADAVHYPDPTLFQFIHRVIELVGEKDVSISLCGEIGANPIFTPLFMGLGLDELSMAPMRIPEVKLVAMHCSKEKARDFAEEALSLSVRSEVKEWVRSDLGPYVQNILKERDIPPESREFDYYERREKDEY